MYHLDNTSGVPEMPEPKEEQSISPRWFGESQQQGGISWPGADWFNTVQAELLNLLDAAGITPEKRSFDQLSKAIPVLGDAKLRQNILSSDGFGLIGQALFSDIREYQGDVTSIMCNGCHAYLDGGQGIFDLVPGGNAMAIPDDNCVHLRDGQGRLWKRRDVSNVIKMAWAGAKNMLETSEPQDVAFANCLQAAASLSPDGYIQSIIEGDHDAPIYLNDTHYIRGGNFSESTAWEAVDKMSSRFGLIGIWAGGRVDKDILFCVQMHKPLFNFIIDNTLLEFTYENYKGKTREEQQAVVDANRFLRMEALVNAPEFDVSGMNYPGTCVYSLGKSNYADVTAHWPDLNKVLPSIQNIGKAFFNFKSCGRDFLVRANGAGLGHIQSIWSQNMLLPGHLKDLYDVHLTYENFVPHEEDTGGFILENVGGNLGMVNIGAGGKGNLCIWDCPQLFITATTGICGGPDYDRSNPEFYLIEVCNSNVTWAAIHPQNAGKFMRVGFNSRIHLLDIDGWDVSKLLEITSDISKYKYRGTRSSLTKDDTRVFVGRSFLQNLNAASLGFPCEPVITIDETTVNGRLVMDGAQMNGIHNGYAATGTEAQMAIVECKAIGNFVVTGRNSKLEGNNTNYPLRLSNKNQLGSWIDCELNFCRVRYTNDGSQSPWGMREATHDLGDTVVPNGTAWQYSFRRPGRYGVDLEIPASGGSISVTLNGFVLYRYTAPGKYRIAFVMHFQEQVTIIYTGGVIESNPQWRYILEG